MQFGRNLAYRDARGALLAGLMGPIYGSRETQITGIMEGSKILVASPMLDSYMHVHFPRNAASVVR